MTETPPTPAPICQSCGAPEALQCGDHWLCLDCYSQSGSCCSGEEE